MLSVDIKNKNLLNILNDFEYTFINKYDIIETNTFLEGPEDPYWCSEQYLKKLMSTRREHDGFPLHARSYCIKPDHYFGNDKLSYQKDYGILDEKIRLELGVKISALSQLYPPGGYISWHTNENASAYNLLFTWNESGNGCFKYFDSSINEIVHIQDKKGWSCKAGYFGSYNEIDKIVYHCASTDSRRITLSYVLGHDVDYWKDVIEHINNF